MDKSSLVLSFKKERIFFAPSSFEIAAQVDNARPPLPRLRSSAARGSLDLHAKNVLVLFFVLAYRLIVSGALALGLSFDKEALVAMTQIRIRPWSAPERGWRTPRAVWRGLRRVLGARPA